MLLVLLLSLTQTSVDECSPSSLQVLQDALVLAGRAGPMSTQSMLVEAAKSDPDCAALLGAGWSISGWAAARAAVRHGGTPESLVDVKWAGQVLEKVGQSPEWRVESEYARAAINAAAAAAQDERSEMAIFLAHARGLSDRLTLARATPRWPLPIDALEGELWLEVDRYDEALAAFERAVELERTAFALAGLARTRDRLGDKAGACEAYRQAAESADRTLLDEARSYLASPACRGRSLDRPE